MNSIADRKRHHSSWSQLKSTPTTTVLLVVAMLSVVALLVTLGGGNPRASAASAVVAESQSGNALDQVLNALNGISERLTALEDSVSAGSAVAAAAGGASSGGAGKGSIVPSKGKAHREACSAVLKEAYGIDHMSIHKGDVYSNFHATVNGPPQKDLKRNLQGWGLHKEGFGTILAGLPNVPQLIFEVGAWKGRSTAAMAAYMKKQSVENTRSDLVGSDGKPCFMIISVDTWLGTSKAWTHLDEFGNDLRRNNGYPSVYYQFLYNMLDDEADDVVVPFPVPAQVGAIYMKEKKIHADAIFIDACHDYPCVKSDLTEWWPFLRPGGVLFGDDYSSGHPGVKKAVNEFAEEHGLEVQTVDVGYVLQKPTENML